MQQIRVLSDCSFTGLVVSAILGLGSFCLWGWKVVGCAWVSSFCGSGEAEHLWILFFSARWTLQSLGRICLSLSFQAKTNSQYGFDLWSGWVEGKICCNPCLEWMNHSPCPRPMLCLHQCYHSEWVDTSQETLHNDNSLLSDPLLLSDPANL